MKEVYCKYLEGYVKKKVINLLFWVRVFPIWCIQPLFTPCLNQSILWPECRHCCLQRSDLCLSDLDGMLSFVLRLRVDKYKTRQCSRSNICFKELIFRNEMLKPWLLYIWWQFSFGTGGKILHLLFSHLVKITDAKPSTESYTLWCFLSPLKWKKGHKVEVDFTFMKENVFKCLSCVFFSELKIWSLSFSFSSVLQTWFFSSLS